MLNIYHIHNGKIQHRLSHTTSLCLLQPLMFTTSTNPSVTRPLILNRFLSEISYQLSINNTPTIPPKLRLLRIYMFILRSRRYITNLNSYLLTGDNQ